MLRSIADGQIDRVVHQLEEKSKYLYMYLDALFGKDAQSILPYSDRMVSKVNG